MDESYLVPTPQTSPAGNGRNSEERRPCGEPETLFQEVLSQSRVSKKLGGPNMLHRTAPVHISLPMCSSQSDR